MPVLDGSFEAFVTNLGKYNEGELVGEWVHFPTTEEEMKEVFERIGIGSKGEFGQVYEEWFITDYDCSIHGVSNLLGEYENLDKLNYLAARLDEMSRSELEHFVAIMDSGCDEVNDLDDLINLTYNLDNYDFIPDIKDYDDLGRYYFFEGGYNIDNKFGSFVDYIDFERYGEDCAINEGGTLTDAGYIRPTGDSWNRYFDGTLEDIPDEYRVTGSGEELEQPSTITVLVVEPDKKPYVKEIPSSLESLQHEVGGDIEAVYPFEEPVAIVCNGEGKMNGLPLNRALRDDNGEIYDKVFNLKQMAQTMNYLSEHNLLEYAVLEEKAAAATAHHNELSAQIKAAEKRMAEIAVLRTHIVNYAKTREVYVAYRKAGYSKKFREEHEEEILLHQAAKNAFDEMGVKKLPKVKELQTEYAKLLEEKKKTYAEYRRSREEMRELLTTKANVDRVLKMEVEQDVEKEKDHGQR